MQKRNSSGDAEEIIGERPYRSASEAPAAPRVVEFVGSPIGVSSRQWRYTGRSWPLSGIRLLAPGEPSKIVCVGRNYREHAGELGNPVPREPLLFLKPPSSLIGPEEPILLPKISQRVDYEGEIAIIMGHNCSHLSAGEPAEPYIFGYTCLNDVTARDLQRLDVQFTRAKGFDTFCPLGPLIETDLNLTAVTLRTFVNGKVRQAGCPADMIFSVDVIIRAISRVMTLLPGDVIATGTPAGVGAMHPGDVVEIELSGLGTLRNSVAEDVGGSGVA